MLSYKQHFYKQRQLKLEKNQVNAKEHSEAEFFLHGNNSHSSSRLYSIRLIIVKTKMKMKSRSHKYDINRPSPDMRTNIANIKSVSVWRCLYILRNTWATFEPQFMKQFSNTDAELIKSFAHEKTRVTALTIRLIKTLRVVNKMKNLPIFLLSINYSLRTVNKCKSINSVLWSYINRKKLSNNSNGFYRLWFPVFS